MNIEKPILKIMYSGRLLDLSRLRVSDIELNDILAGLRQSRYTYQCPYHYSVAQHSLLMREYFWYEKDYDAAVYSLVHDMSEAYIGDMHTNLKHHASMGAYRELEQRVQSVIERWFYRGPGPGRAVRARVKDADTRIRSTEMLTFWPDYWAQLRKIDLAINGDPLPVLVEQLPLYEVMTSFKIKVQDARES